MWCDEVYLTQSAEILTFVACVCVCVRVLMCSCLVAFLVSNQGTLETAAAISAYPTYCMPHRGAPISKLRNVCKTCRTPPWIIGCSMPSMFVKAVRNGMAAKNVYIRLIFHVNQCRYLSSLTLSPRYDLLCSIYLHIWMSALVCSGIKFSLPTCCFTTDISTFPVPAKCGTWFPPITTQTCSLE